MSFNAVHLPMLTALASNSPISENRRTGRRSQCAAIWSSDRAITKATYMDARLRDTAEAVESLPSFPIAKTEPRTLAPNVGNQGPLESFPDHLGDNLPPTDGQETKKPRETLGFTGFSEERLMRFELTTTTLATLQQPEQKGVNHGANRDAAESLHHWLHLIAESDERNAGSVLLDALLETVGAGGIERLIDALIKRA